MRFAPKLLVVAVALSGAATACSSSAGSPGKLLVVTTVSPITDLARNVAGTAATVKGIIPEGVDSHTFEPTPESARLLAAADVIFLNGLHLEDPTLKLAQANHQAGAVIFLTRRQLDAALGAEPHAVCELGRARRADHLSSSGRSERRA